MPETNVVSPYAAASLVTEWLKKTEFDGQKISPQMMYQYVDAERIPAHRNSEGHWQIYEEDLRAWFEKYVARKRNLAAKATNAASNSDNLRKTA